MPFEVSGIDLTARSHILCRAPAITPALLKRKKLSPWWPANGLGFSRAEHASFACEVSAASP